MRQEGEEPATDMTPDGIPVRDLHPSVRPVLWSYELHDDATMPQITVAAAVMDRGDLVATRWLLHTVGQPRLRTVLPRVARRMSPRSVALWACLLEVDPPVVDRIAWVAA